MLNRKLLAGLAAAALCGATAIHGSSQASAQTEIPAADAQTIAIVEAANGFLATLSEAQRKAAVFDFMDAAQRVNWSNFPLGGPGANWAGVRWGDMDEAQRAALIGLLGSVLSAALQVIE